MKRRAKGATLVEILISLAVVLVGMLALFRTLAVSVVGSGTSSRISQAQLRATAILEAIRAAPKPALDCLVTTTAPGWAACETVCQANLTSPLTTKPQACIFTTATAAALSGPSAQGLVQLPSTDRAGQQYGLVYFSVPPIAPDGSTRTTAVTTGGPGGLVYDIQVTVGWHDDGTAGVSNPPVNGDHFVTLRTAVAGGA
ncbi:MAG TPA: prepilin-type N-terminal cleavage/methylation domain-containing protein [Polyangia bacterium]|nr:prepilin-type N-terminal cleavage/methylation domain-containing protein [Polyangia bacterium]